MDEDRNKRRGAQEIIRQQHRDLLSELGGLCDVRFDLKQGDAPSGPASAQILSGGSPTGWWVVADAGGSRRERAAQLAARMLGAELTAQQKTAELAREEFYERQSLDFLYEMSQSVAALFDEQEICDFVVQKAAQLMGCDRVSLMLYEPDSQMLRIRASVGVPQHIASTVSVRPGERISGKVFESGREVVVGADDPLPDESLGVRELRKSPAFLSVPLTVPSADEDSVPQILGVVNLTGRGGGEAFTPEDLKVVHTVAAHTAAQVHNCRLLNAERERQRLDEQIQLASEIQMSLLPAEPLCVGPLEVAGVCRPAQRVRGDFFDYWEQEGRVCIVVADVSGHDLRAALLATAFRSVVRTVAGQGNSVSQLVAQINRAMYPDLSRAEMLITLCYLEVRPESGELTLCRCGHPYPLLLRGAEDVWLETGGPLLGLQEDAEFEQESLQLLPGDVLVLCTDGVLEAAPPQEGQFGMRGLAQAVEATSAGPASAVARAVLSAVERHMDGFKMNDDATVVAACYAGNGGGR